MSTIFLNDLCVTQHGPRHPRNSLRQMVQHVANGGFWTADILARCHAALSLTGPPKRIELVRVEDGNMLLLDGHHRCASTWLGGRTYLREDEYQLHERTYAWFLEPNPASGYYLTFDPRIQVRSADFLSFQREAPVHFEAARLAGKAWPGAHAARYLSRRVKRTVPEFAQAINRHMLEACPGENEALLEILRADGIEPSELPDSCH